MPYPISSIIDVSNLIENPPIVRKTFGDMLILADDTAGSKDRVKEYATLQEVGDDWGTSSPAYIMATAYFSNGLYGKPKKLYIGVHDTSGVETLTEALDAIVAANSLWYIMAPTNEFSDIDISGTIAPFIEANALSFIGSYNTINVDTYNPGLSTDLASVLQALNLDRALTNFEVSEVAAELYLSAAINALPATVDFTPSRGAFTMANKSLVGQTAADLLSAAYTAMEAKNANFYTKVTEVNTNVYRNGKMASGQSFDTIQNTDFIKYEMTVDLFAFLNVNPKAPYTQDGIDQIKSVLIATLGRMNAAGVIGTGFDQTEGRIIENGFEVSFPDISDITPTQKATRILAAVETRLLLSGAIESIVVTNYIQV